MIKPIETVHNGYRFRSRLEARWAVFFDAMGIKYDYEKEGYDLKEAGWYLPDFWLPEYEIWVEIKPHTPGIPTSFYDDAHKKAEALKDLTGYPVLLCYGKPKEVWHYLYGEAYEGYATFGPNSIIAMDRCESGVFGVGNIKTLYQIAKSELEADDFLSSLLDMEEYMDEVEDRECCQFVETGGGRVWEAAREAWQARFEQGRR